MNDAARKENLCINNMLICSLSSQHAKTERMSYTKIQSDYPLKDNLLRQEKV
jgi:hypothetical protein